MISSYIMLLAGPLENIGSMYTAMQKSTASLYDFINEMRGGERKNTLHQEGYPMQKHINHTVKYPVFI